MEHNIVEPLISDCIGITDLANCDFFPYEIVSWLCICLQNTAQRNSRTARRLDLDQGRRHDHYLRLSQHVIRCSAHFAARRLVLIAAEDTMMFDAIAFYYFLGT